MGRRLPRSRHHQAHPPSVAVATAAVDRRCRRRLHHRAGHRHRRASLALAGAGAAVALADLAAAAAPVALAAAAGIKIL